MAAVASIKVAVDAREARAGAEEAQKALNDVAKSAKTGAKQLELFEDAAEDAAHAEEQLAKETDKTTRKQKSQTEQTKKQTKEVNGLEKVIGTAAKGFAGLFATISAGIVVFDTLRTLMQFEDGLVGVGKTTDILGEDLDRLGAKIIGLSSSVRAGQEELLAIAQAAGQLGVEGEAAILAFTETVAKLGQASDLVGEEAATKLARMLTVTGEAAETVGTLGAVIVELGNNMAATESEIAHTATQVALATAVFGTSSAEASALGATLAAMGIRAELAGSSMGRALRSIDAAIREGGDRMRTLEQITGASAEAIRDTFEESAVDGLQLFLDGLKRVSQSGGDTTEALAALGLNGEEVLKVLPALALNADELSVALERANEQVENATALDIEAARGFETLGAQTERLGSAIDALQVSFKASGGALKSIVEFAGDVVFALAGVDAQFRTSETAANAFAVAIKILAVPATFAGVFIGISAITKLVVALKAATVAAGGLNAVLMANPIGLVVGAIAAAASAFLLFSNNADAATNSVRDNSAEVDRLRFSLQALEDVRAGRAVAERRGDTEGQIRALQSEADTLLGVLAEIEKEGEAGISATRLADLLGEEPGAAAGRAFSAAFLDAADAGLNRDQLIDLLKQRGFDPAIFEFEQVDSISTITGRRSTMTMRSQTPTISEVPRQSEFAFTPTEATAAADIEQRIRNINGAIAKLRETMASEDPFGSDKLDKAKLAAQDFEAELSRTEGSLRRILSGESTEDQERITESIRQQVAQAKALLEAADITDPAALQVLRAQIEEVERLKTALADQTSRDKAIEKVEEQTEALRLENETRAKFGDTADLELELLEAANDLREAGVEDVEALVAALRQELQAKEDAAAATKRLNEAEKAAEASRKRAANEAERLAQQQQRAREQLLDSINGLRIERELLDKNNFERERFLEILRLEQMLRAAGLSLTKEQAEAVEEELKGLQENGYFRQIADSMAGTVGQGIRDLIQGTKDFEQALADTAANIGMLVIDKVLIEPLVDGLSDSLMGITGDLFQDQATDALGSAQASAALTTAAATATSTLTTGATTAGTTLQTSATTAAGTMKAGMLAGAAAIEAAAIKLAAANAASVASAKGNAFSGGDLVPFAYGGVVNRATTFPMADGRIGLMGEAGPEAILPLKRDSQGRLGVSAGGSQTVNNVTNVTMNVKATDADSFRRSRKQISQDLRRI